MLADPRLARALRDRRHLARALRWLMPRCHIGSEAPDLDGPLVPRDRCTERDECARCIALDALAWYGPRVRGRNRG